jgi:hypothetical protein
MRHLLCFAAAVALSACSEEYVYRPAVNASATVGGRVAAYYEIPPESPRGSVRLASAGYADLGPKGGKPVRAVHLRLVVSNNDSTAWSVDAREQRIDIPGHGSSRPAYVGTKAVAPPLVNIPPGEKRVIDMFYPLPEGLKEASQIPEFDALWSVETPARVVTERTPFDRLEVQPAYAYDPGWGWGWYDPLYPYGGFSDPARVVGVPVWIEPPYHH